MQVLPDPNASSEKCCILLTYSNEKVANRDIS